MVDIMFIKKGIHLRTRLERMMKLQKQYEIEMFLERIIPNNKKKKEAYLKEITMIQPDISWPKPDNKESSPVDMKCRCDINPILKKRRRD